MKATALKVGAQAGFKTAISNPDFPRNLTIKGGQAGQDKVVKIYGTNFAGEPIDESFTSSGTDEVVGTKAFKTVTKVDLPVWNTDAVDTISIGVGTIFGLPYILKSPAQLLLVTSADLKANALSVIEVNELIELNVYKPNAADVPDATKSTDLYLIV